MQTAIASSTCSAGSGCSTWGGTTHACGLPSPGAAPLGAAEGTRFLARLGGWGLFKGGRNTPRVGTALVGARGLALRGWVQPGPPPLPPPPAEELLRRTPPRLERVLFTSSG